VKLAGRVAVPLPRSAANALAAGLWLARASEAPPCFLNYLQYVCVADGDVAEREMGFSPMYTTREAVVDYASAQRLRDVRLLSESAA
jgi:UDP-glucose 4-epimerase